MLALCWVKVRGSQQKGKKKRKKTNPEEEVGYMLQSGVIELADVAWSSPVVKDGLYDGGVEVNHHGLWQAELLNFRKYILCCLFLVRELMFSPHLSSWVSSCVGYLLLKKYFIKVTIVALCHLVMDS